MPNNEPVTMGAETLRKRMENAEKKILVNVGFYSEFPKNISEIRAIFKEGAVAFKLFMADQVGGLDIDDDYAISEAFKTICRLNGLVAVHAEDRKALNEKEDELKRASCSNVEAFLKAHSEDVEAKAVRRLLNIVKQTSTQLHFCHVSSEKGMKAIIEAKKSGMHVSCETTPHHLLLSSDVYKRQGTLALTMPPIREKKHAGVLWDAVKNRWIDVFASDHAPHALEEKKTKSVWDVKVGIPNLETMLPLLLTEVKRGRASIGDVVRLMGENPAKLFKLRDRGFLKEGNHADLTIVDLNRRYKIDASKFHSKAKYSPFDKRVAEGKPVKTFVDGRLIIDEDEVVAEAGGGKIIRREYQ
jgi:dihydroorotase